MKDADVDMPLADVCSVGRTFFELDPRIEIGLSADSGIGRSQPLWIHIERSNSTIDSETSSEAHIRRTTSEA